MKLALALGLASFGFGAALPAGRLVDLTHPLEGKPAWPNEKSSALERGTYASAGKDGLKLEGLMGPAAVVDVSASCARNRDYQLTRHDLLAWERLNGKLPPGAFLLVRTGFSKYWGDRERYLGTKETGPHAAARMHFPGVHPLAAKWLLENRKPAAIAIESAAVDHGPSRFFESRKAFAARGVVVFENAAGLERLPPKGAYAIGLPMRVNAGAGAPARLIAIVDK